MIKEAIALLNKKEDLDDSMVEQVMGEIMTGEATDAQKAAFLTALSMKGETISEIATAAKYLRDHCEHFENDKDVLEIVGTGGDGSNTINISTIASLIVSAGVSPWQNTETAPHQASVEQQTAWKPLGLRLMWMQTR